MSSKKINNSGITNINIAELDKKNEKENPKVNSSFRKQICIKMFDYMFF